MALPEGRERLLGILLWVRYALPIFAAAFLAGVGAFYNIYAVEGGKAIRLSLWRLCFHALESARAYFLKGELVQGVRNFYLLVVFLALLLMLLFVLALALAVFAIYILYTVKQAQARGDAEAKRQAKIRMRAFLPNRHVLWLSTLPMLLMALFPEIFSRITRYYSMASNTAFHVRCNVPAILIGVVLLGAWMLDVYLRRYERALHADLFTIDGDGDSADGGGESDEEDEPADGEE